MEVLKVSVESLQSFIADNKADLTDEQFTNDYLDSVIEGLKLTPGLYRTYGGYWWPLKRLLMERPSYPDEFGTDVDTELDSAFSYDSAELTIAAAYIEQQANLSDKMMSDTHFVYEAPDGESVEVILEDPDMERLLFAAQLLEQI